MAAYQAEIDDIIDNFDFDTVHRVMVFLEWPWARYGRTPTPTELAEQARKLIVTSLTESNGARNVLETGGLCVTTEVHDNRAYIDLGFKIVTYDNC